MLDEHVAFELPFSKKYNDIMLYIRLIVYIFIAVPQKTQFVPLVDLHLVSREVIQYTLNNTQREWERTRHDASPALAVPCAGAYEFLIEKIAILKSSFQIRSNKDAKGVQ